MMAAFHLLMRGSSCAEVGMVGVADRALAARPQRVHSAFARARMPDEHGDRTVPRGVRPRRPVATRALAVSLANLRAAPRRPIDNGMAGSLPRPYGLTPLAV